MPDGRLGPWRCTACGEQGLSAGSPDGREAVTCPSCFVSYPRLKGIWDFLATPSLDVTKELRGLAKENHIPPESSLTAIKFLSSDHVDSISDLMSKSRGDAIQYYQQTSAAFFEAMGRARPEADLKVLEIGAERRFFKLRVIEGLCSEAYALNIFFESEPDWIHLDFPIRVLGDMNSLPFADCYFDLVICSATLHHSALLETALSELWRVLTLGGRAIIINEPVLGRLKSWGGSLTHDREDDIHEDAITYATWRRAFARTSFRVDSFVPNWFVDQLRTAGKLPEGARFANLSRKLAPLAQSSTSRDLLATIGRIPAQALLGVPINSVLWKEGSP